MRWLTKQLLPLLLLATAPSELTANDGSQTTPTPTPDPCPCCVLVVEVENPNPCRFVPPALRVVRADPHCWKGEDCDPPEKTLIPDAAAPEYVDIESENYDVWLIAPACGEPYELVRRWDKLPEGYCSTYSGITGANVVRGELVVSGQTFTQFVRCDGSTLQDLIDELGIGPSEHEDIDQRKYYVAECGTAVPMYEEIDDTGEVTPIHTGSALIKTEATHRVAWRFDDQANCGDDAAAEAEVFIQIRDFSVSVSEVEPSPWHDCHGPIDIEFTVSPQDFPGGSGVLRVLNGDGDAVHEGPVDSHGGTHTHEFDPSALPPGEYSVKVEISRRGCIRTDDKTLTVEPIWPSLSINGITADANEVDFSLDVWKDEVREIKETADEAHEFAQFVERRLRLYEENLRILIDPETANSSDAQQAINTVIGPAQEWVESNASTMLGVQLNASSAELISAVEALQQGEAISDLRHGVKRLSVDIVIDGFATNPTEEDQYVEVTEDGVTFDSTNTFSGGICDVRTTLIVVPACTKNHPIAVVVRMTGNLGTERLKASFLGLHVEFEVQGEGFVELPSIKSVIEVAKEEADQLEWRARELRQIAFALNSIVGTIGGFMALIEAASALSYVGTPIGVAVRALFDLIEHIVNGIAALLEGVADGLDATRSRLCERASELVVKLEAELPERCPTGCRENEAFSQGIAVCGQAFDLRDLGDPNCTSSGTNDCEPPSEEPTP